MQTVTQHAVASIDREFLVRDSLTSYLKYKRLFTNLITVTQFKIMANPTFMAHAAVRNEIKSA